MLTIRCGSERGYFDHGWLQTHHSFSFADYYDPKHMHFGSLRVINEDVVAPGAGFPMHSHQDMEILTYVISGTLEHQDSLGHKAQIRPGQVQYMSAGTGITHSEYNPSRDEPVHLLQIWVIPPVRGLAPAYAERDFNQEEKRNTWLLLAAPEAESGVMSVHQDCRLLISGLQKDQQLDYTPDASRQVYLHVVQGNVKVNGQGISAGDAAYGHVEHLQLEAEDDAELLLFDLAT